MISSFNCRRCLILIMWYSSNKICSLFSLVKFLRQSDFYIDICKVIINNSYSYFIIFLDIQIEMDVILILALTLLVVFIGALFYVKKRQPGLEDFCILFRNLFIYSKSRSK